MEFSVSTSIFSQAIDEVIKAVPTKSTLPVLEHIKMELIGNKLFLVATDQDLTIKTECDVIGFADGAILVPALRLNELVKANKDSMELQFIANLDNFEITIKNGKDVYKFSGLNANEYLELPEFTYNSSESFVINRLDFQKGLEVAFCCSNDEFRPSMTGVYIEFGDNNINFVSTDSYRLANVFSSLVTPINANFILPKKSALALKKINSDVTISLIENNEKYSHVSFDLGNTKIISRLIDEKYPPYQSVIPKDNDKVLIVDKAKLLQAVKKAAILTNKHSKQIKLEITEKNISILGQDEDSGNTASTSVSCEFNSDEFIYGMNYQYLIEAIEKSFTDDSLKFTFSSETRPCLIESDNQRLLIMPVRI